MKKIRLLLLMLFTTFIVMSVSAQESYTFPHGPTLNLPAGWQVEGDSDEFGNLSISRPDGDFVTVGMPPPAQIAPVLAEQGIDINESLQPLLEAVVESRLVNFEDGTLDTAMFGDADTLIFNYVDGKGAMTYMYLAKYPNQQILLIELDFEADVEQAVLDDVAVILESVTFSADTSASADATQTPVDAEKITTPENLRLFTMRDNTMFAAPANWDMIEFSEPYGSYRFRIDDSELQFELPSVDAIETALADLGFAEDEVISGLLEMNITAEHLDAVFDADNIEFTDIEGGQLASYRSVQDGETLVLFIAEFDNQRLVALRIETMSDYTDEFDTIVRAMFDTVTFDGTPADFSVLSELVGEIEATVPPQNTDADTDTDAEEPSPSADYLETKTMMIEGDSVSFEYPAIWIVTSSEEDDTGASFDDIYSNAQIELMLPSAEEIAPGLEELGIDPESETLAVDMMQMLLARVDADGNIEMPPAEDIETFETTNASVAFATDIDGGYVNHFYLLAFNNGRLALMNISGEDVPDALFEAIPALVESFDFGE